MTILACLAVYFVVCIAIGLASMRRTRDATDYFLAGRTLGPWLAGMATFSSIVSGFLFVGGPGLFYRMGMSPLWMMITGGLGGALASLLVARPLRLLSELRGIVSLPAAIEARYRSRTASLLTSLTILCGVFSYLGAQVLAMGSVLRVLLHAAGYEGEASLTVCVFASCGVVLFYSVSGGMLASVWTDLFQGIIMITASAFVFATAITVWDDGFETMDRVIFATDEAAMMPFGRFGMAGCFAWFLMFSVGGCGQPHVITKNMMLRDLRDLRRVAILNFVAGTLAVLTLLAIGTVMRATVAAGDHPPIGNPDAAAPAFLLAFAHPVLAGVVFAALFAAIMSTADSFLNIGAAVLVQDIPRALRGRTPTHDLAWARVATLAIAALSGVTALLSGDLVAILGAFGWSTFAAALVPLIAIGFHWKRATASGAIASVVISLVLNLGGKAFPTWIPRGVDVGTFALLASIATFLAMGFASRPPRIDPDVEAMMDV